MGGFLLVGVQAYALFYVYAKERKERKQKQSGQSSASAAVEDTMKFENPVGSDE